MFSVRLLVLAWQIRDVIRGAVRLARRATR